MMSGLARTPTRIATVVAVAGLLVVTAPALAAGSNMPWEQPLQQILQSIEGPVTKIIAVIIIIVTGLSLAFGDAGGGFRRLIQIVFGLSIAFTASSFFLSFFSFGGGVLICCGRSATWPPCGPANATRCSSRWSAGMCAIRPISGREVT